MSNDNSSHAWHIYLVTESKLNMAGWSLTLVGFCKVTGSETHSHVIFV